MCILILCGPCLTSLKLLASLFPALDMTLQIGVTLDAKITVCRLASEAQALSLPRNAYFADDKCRRPIIYRVSKQVLNRLLNCFRKSRIRLNTR